MWRNPPKNRNHRHLSKGNAGLEIESQRRKRNKKEALGNLLCRPTASSPHKGRTGARFIFCHQADKKYLYISFLLPRICILPQVYSFRSTQSYCAHQRRHPTNRLFLSCGDQTVRTVHQPCRRPRSLHSSLSLPVLHWIILLSNCLFLSWFAISNL